MRPISARYPRQWPETVEHPFGTLKLRMGATHFLMKRLPKVTTEMALHVLAYIPTRVMNIMGVRRLSRMCSSEGQTSSRQSYNRPQAAFATIAQCQRAAVSLGDGGGDRQP